LLSGKKFGISKDVVYNPLGNLKAKPAIDTQKE
jgi:hypothetical protein